MMLVCKVQIGFSSAVLIMTSKRVKEMYANKHISNRAARQLQFLISKKVSEIYRPYLWFWLKKVT